MSDCVCSGVTWSVSSDVFLFPDFPLALPPFAPDFSFPTSSSLPTHTCCFFASFFPLPTAFFFLVAAGVLQVLFDSNFEVAGVSVEAEVSNMCAPEEHRSFVRSRSLANSWKGSLTPTHLTKDARRGIFGAKGGAENRS